MKLRGWKEIEAHTGFSRKTLLRLIRRKRLAFPAAKIAGQWVTTKTLYEKWIETHVTHRKPRDFDDFST